jgi:hypothetical protein
MIIKIYAKTRNQGAGGTLWGSVASTDVNSGSRGSSTRGTSKNDEKLFKGASIKRTWADKKKEAKAAREREMQKQLQEEENKSSLLGSATVAHKRTVT